MSWADVYSSEARKRENYLKQFPEKDLKHPMLKELQVQAECYRLLEAKERKRLRHEAIYGSG